jgi:N6-L-threonylcarbamoyladenine synthase
MMLVLGVESSCDDTAAAVVDDGKRILSNIVSSQIPVHRDYGGVVPELASRHHIRNIIPVISEALTRAELKLDDIDAFAVTRGPGLIGSLLVGLSFMKAVAYASGKPFVALSHLEAHIHSVFIENEGIEFPALALVVSGGHTSLFQLTEPFSYRLLGKTRDDAAGEAFDKVAKLLSLGYPGGPVIEKLAEGIKGDIPFPVARISDGSLDFSFSGLKTAVLRYVKQGIPDEGRDYWLKNIAASFEEAVFSAICDRLERAARFYNPRSILVSGGVACNRWLRKRISSFFQPSRIKVYFPSPELSTDNGVMVAALGYFKLKRGEDSGFSIDADADLTLGMEADN